MQKAPLTKTQISNLSAPLEQQMVKTTQGQKYIPSTFINDQLNRIFGFCEWSMTTISTEIVHKDFNAKLSNGGVAVEVVAMATVEIKIHKTGAVYQDVSTGSSKMGINSVSKVFDTAIKSAVSTAQTRATRHMGMQFGNVLYQLKSGVYTSSLPNENFIEVGDFSDDTIEANIESQQKVVEQKRNAIVVDTQIQFLKEKLGVNWQNMLDAEKLTEETIKNITVKKFMEIKNKGGL
jgi:hypothetical protein